MHRERDCDTRDTDRDTRKGNPPRQGGSDGASGDRQRRISCVDLGGGDIEAPSSRVPRASSPCLPNNAQSARAQTQQPISAVILFFLSLARSFILACTRGGEHVFGDWRAWKKPQGRRS
ncbi:hypothetical protein ISCGN_018517 [Ixodes scapularis]